MDPDTRLSRHDLLHPTKSYDVPSVNEPRPEALRPSSAIAPAVSASQSLQVPDQHLHRLRADRDDENKRRRFSLLRFRNASDSQLSLRARRDAEREKPPPLPRGWLPLPSSPSFLDSAEGPTTTATIEASSTTLNVPKKKRSRISLAIRMRHSGASASLDDMLNALQHKPDLTKSSADNVAAAKPSPLAASIRPDETEEVNAGVPINTSAAPSTPVASNPPIYGEHEASVLAVPVSRVSDSSRSDASSAIYASTTTTHTTVKTTTTFFRLRKKPPELFPISHLPQSSQPKLPGSGNTSSLSASHTSLAPPGPSGSQGSITPPRPSFAERAATASPAGAALTFTHTNPSGGSSPTRSQTFRGRSSTLSSAGRDSMEDHPPPSTSRTSSTAGRKSFGDLLGLGRLRHNSELGRTSTLTPSTPGSTKNNSFQMQREPSFVLPERREDDTPAKYLARLEEVVSRGVVASLLSKATDAFAQAALRSYMRSFSFFGDPMDMAIRKLLMEAELPKETQQIDRCLQAFANRYHECNPGIYSTPDQAYFIAFSLLILHTDVFNKNNKRKMQKSDYLKNTRGEGIFDNILECFFDNISYTPFIHVEDDLDINGDRIISHKLRKKAFFAGGGTEALRRTPKEMIDPYNLIIDGKLGQLRPSLRDVMNLDDNYHYLGTANHLDLHDLQKAFFRTGVLQIISARSRPDAFMSEKTTTNPESSHPGIVDIKITKVGLLWRKDSKKKKTRSPWQEWGAILTGSQLYFFRNTAWIKSLISQYDTHIKQGHDDTPLIFKPPLEHFKPDSHISTDGAVALVDSTYKKHKNAFIWVPHGGFEEVLLADSEEEMNDWLAKLNYAAAFRTSGVRIRGVMGGNYENHNRRTVRRLNSSEATQVIQTPTGEVSISRSRMDPQMADDILVARRSVMRQKIAEANEKLAATEKQLESQLRNARHLQILAPIQAKTREDVLLAAARMSAQLKWTRVEMWRLKCHRDILLEDLDEEQRLNSAPPKPKEATPGKPTLPQIDPPAPSSPPVPKTPSSPCSSHNSLVLPASPVASVADNASASDTLRASPTRSKAPSSVRPDSIPTPQDQYAYTVSGSPPPSPRIVSSASKQDTHEEAASSASQTPKKTCRIDDENEQELLREAGLLEAAPISTPDRTSNLVSDMFDEADAPGSADRMERGKIRRSLHRTLREGAGHLSHRNKRVMGKEGAISTIPDELIRDDVLTRVTGSFVVHGKKASVINFGSEFQSISNEEKLRQRRQTLGDDGTPIPSAIMLAAHAASSSSVAVVDEEDAGHPHWASDFMPTRSHRESTASTDTATARSFRELHRKYSSAQAARVTSAGGRLTIPSDDDSDAAVSFSDGWRTPLPADPDIAEEREGEGDNGNGESRNLTLTPAQMSSLSLLVSNSTSDLSSQSEEPSLKTEGETPGDLEQRPQPQQQP